MEPPNHSSTKASSGPVDIEGNLSDYLGAREPTARYASFDYCFNHCRSHSGIGELATPSLMELSCLHLGFYLASWGMLRGSSVLLRRSIKHYAPVIEVVASTRPEIWEIDANAYTETAIDGLLETARRLRGALPDGASDILVTKIMFGVFGCLPAFDTHFEDSDPRSDADLSTSRSRGTLPSVPT